MIERKSSRARKSVDYSKFASEEDSDDDFKDSTPPVAKRQKLSSNKENSLKQNEKPAQTKKEPRPKKERQPLEEKLYERELQKALELSLSQSDGSQENPATKATPVSEEPTVVKETENTELPVLIEEDDLDSGVPSPILPKIDPPVLSKVTDEDEIEVLETGIKAENDKKGSSSSHRKATTKKRCIESDSDGEDPDFEVDLRKFLQSPLRTRKKDEDSDFEIDKDDDDISDDSDDDFNADDSDDDFGVSNKKKGKKTTSTPKQGKAAKAEKPTKKTAKKDTKSSAKGSVKQSSSGLAKPAITKTGSTTPGLKKSAAFNSPVVSKPISSITVNKTPSAGLPSRKSTNWTPPAPSTNSKSPAGCASLTSPSTGLRIGLSRNMKLKPLHPNLKIHN